MPKRQRTQQYLTNVIKSHKKKRCAQKSSQSHFEKIDNKLHDKIQSTLKISINNSTYNRMKLNCHTCHSTCNSDIHYIGKLDVDCKRGCGALHFKNEKTRFICCNAEGYSSHVDLSVLPNFLEKLLEQTKFRNQIRHYNNTFQISTLGCTIGKNGIQVNNTFPFFISIHGSLYHVVPPIIPNSNQPAKFAQLYILDNALENILSKNNEIDPSIAKLILEYLQKKNPWAKAVKKSFKLFQKKEINIQQIQLNIIDGKKQFKAPLTKEIEIAGFVPSESMEFNRCRSVRLNCTGDQFTYINEFNPMYDPTHYIIMFPNGEKGYTYTTNMTTLQFYQQRIQIHPQRTLGDFSRLFHEYVIDQYCKVEKQRLDYIRTHQKDLRATKNKMTNERPEEMPIGQNEGKSFVYLPGSFTGSPRYFRSKYLDALNMVNTIGPPSLFVTITTNSKWREIQESLKPWETPIDRPDIVTRVFRMKFDSLIKDLCNDNIAGLCLGYLAVNEWQKKSLNHGHLVCILDAKDRPKTQLDVDQLVCAELPNPDTDKDLYSLVTKFMLHGPCTSYCLKEDGNCRFGYPQPFCEKTSWEGDSFVHYRRRNNGRCFVNKLGKRFTNQNVVPYSPYLLRKYQCHLNVLISDTKLASIRYLFKYTTKGVDMSTIKLKLEEGNRNEVEEYISGRYISAPEAIHKLFEYKLIELKPSTERLPVHLPGQAFQILGEVGQERNSQPKPTQLEAFFILNTKRKNENNLSFLLYYHHISRYYTWNTKKNEWKERQRIDQSTTGIVLNRIDVVSIKTEEQYYLRLLLYYIPNPTCYDDLLNVNGKLCNTYQEAAKELGLLTDDATWHDTMHEATLIHPPCIAREIFAHLLSYCELQDPCKLFLEFIGALSEDFRRIEDTTGITPQMQLNAIIDIEKNLNKMGKSLSKYASLSHLLPDNILSQVTIKPTVMYSTLQINQFKLSFESLLSKANIEQSTIINEIILAYQNNDINKNFLLMAAGGTGKTFVINTIIQYIKAQTGTNTSFISMGTTALSAQLLEEGHTAHSTLKLPIDILQGIARSNLEYDSPIALQLKKAKLIIWDEIFSSRKELIDAADIFFKELHGSKKHFGGLLVVFAGDLRQTLPKMHQARRGDIVNICFTRAKCFSSFRIYSLTQNMRLRHSQRHSSWANKLLQIGNGSITTSSENVIKLPPFIQTANNLEELITFIYGNDINILTLDQLSNRAILAPLNRDVRILNNYILEQVLGETKHYYSADEEIDDQGEIIQDVPIEILNNMNPSGLPPHDLQLKIKATVMCIRNLTNEVCNGTKLQIQALHKHLIDCIILTGLGKGKIISVPRIVLTDKSSTDRITLRRKQFPLVLAYVMTIDKSQGQTLDYVGIALRTDCFAHGQLYTALSRCKFPENLIVYKPSDIREFKHNVASYACNIVWKEVFPSNFG